MASSSSNNDPFHEGERLVQQRVGVVMEANRNAPMIGNSIPGGALPFLDSQSLLVLATLHREQLWCLPLVGKPGWMSGTSRALTLALDQTLMPADARILEAAATSAQVGGVVLDFATRRRLRMNGTLHQPSPTRLVLDIEESYPNCPKYITQRTLLPAAPSAIASEGDTLTPELLARLATIDTFFVASRHATRGLDASHRGGNPGFLTSPDSRTLTFADFDGNSLFNTFGNLELDPRIGLLLPDFERHSAIVVTGNASVRFEHQAQDRHVTVTIEHWQQLPLPLAQSSPHLSPYNP